MRGKVTARIYVLSSEGARRYTHSTVAHRAAQRAGDVMRPVVSPSGCSILRHTRRGHAFVGPFSQISRRELFWGR